MIRLIISVVMISLVAISEASVDPKSETLEKDIKKELRKLYNLEDSSWVYCQKWNELNEQLKKMNGKPLRMSPKMKESCRQEATVVDHLKGVRDEYMVLVNAVEPHILGLKAFITESKRLNEFKLSDETLGAQLTKLLNVEEIQKASDNLDSLRAELVAAQNSPDIKNKMAELDSSIKPLLAKGAELTQEELAELEKHTGELQDLLNKWVDSGVSGLLPAYEGTLFGALGTINKFKKPPVVEEEKKPEEPAKEAPESDDEEDEEEDEEEEEEEEDDDDDDDEADVVQPPPKPTKAKKSLPNSIEIPQIFKDKQLVTPEMLNAFGSISAKRDQNLRYTRKHKSR